MECTSSGHEKLFEFGGILQHELVKFTVGLALAPVGDGSQAVAQDTDVIGRRGVQGLRTGRSVGLGHPERLAVEDVVDDDHVVAGRVGRDLESVQ